MRSVNIAHADALAAVVRTGSFDAAARVLHVTPSAVSQRVKALEGTVGQVLVTRERPCRATSAGIPLVRLAEQVGLLSAEALSASGGEAPTLTVVVNADSLDTWFLEALPEVAAAGVRVRLHRADESRTADLLRDGTTVAAVTGDPTPVQGCVVEPLGALRYVAVAAPSIADGLRGRPLATALAAAPRVEYDTDDGLQDAFVAVLGGGPRTPDAAVHLVPSSTAHARAVRLGLGWGMVPLAWAEPDLATGALVRLGARQVLDVPLSWQRWRLGSTSLDLLTDAVRRAAATGLVPLSPTR